MMASFTSAVTKSWSRIAYTPDAVEPRGGSTIIQVGSQLIAFGGTDRIQCHFNDVLMFTDGKWTKVETTGDCPTARSGHAVTAIGKYMFLFGGIDFGEEIDYNDLYLFNTETLEWKYVGEGGAEVLARNSHSLGIISDKQTPPQNYLIVYGGASSEHGPLSDTIWAKLPGEEEMTSTDFFVHWEVLKCDNRVGSLALSPGKREMHSTAYTHGSLYITGGRNYEGELLSDVWSLSAYYPRGDESNVLSWTKMNQLELGISRCAHGSAFVNIGSALHLSLFGGFTGNGEIGDNLLIIEMNPSDNSLPRWSTADVGSDKLEGRFGLCMCSVNRDVVNTMTKSQMGQSKAPFDTADSTLSYPELAPTHASLDAVAIFGGVCAEHDFSEICILSPQVNK